jgi:hypothetical protein
MELRDVRPIEILEIAFLARLCPWLLWFAVSPTICLRFGASPGAELDGNAQRNSGVKPSSSAA